MPPPDEARIMAVELARAARLRSPAASAAGADTLLALDARSLLTLDDRARRPRHLPAAVCGDGFDLGSDLSSGSRSRGTAPEVAAFVAAVASLHVDGRTRERACARLALTPSPLAGRVLALRLLDHVPAVRDRAWLALEPQLNTTMTAAVVDVLVTARARSHAAPALALVTAHVLVQDRAAGVVADLARAPQHVVRRWAYDLGRHHHHLLSAEQLLDAVQRDPDQSVRAACADHLASTGDVQLLRRLLTTSSAPARLAAATRIPAAHLTDEEVAALLLDRSARVRQHARWLAQRRGQDAASIYRRHLAAPQEHRPRTLASCLEGLSDVGDARDLPLMRYHAGAPSARVRLAALGGSARFADRDTAVATLSAALLDPSARVAAAAASALARLDLVGAGSTAAEQAWSSCQPWSRKAAWYLTRAPGSWDRVEADLRASTDRDAQLSGLGLSSLRSWLRVGAATTWAPVSPQRAVRLGDLLDRSPVTDAERRAVAFHAGLPRHDGRESAVTSGVDGARPSPAVRARWWPAAWSRRR